jgi:6-phosphogluconolactonase (cycloisomerase 2 family)
VTEIKRDENWVHKDQLYCVWHQNQKLRVTTYTHDKGNGYLHVCKKCYELKSHLSSVKLPKTRKLLQSMLLATRKVSAMKQEVENRAKEIVEEEINQLLDPNYTPKQQNNADPVAEINQLLEEDC